MELVSALRDFLDRGGDVLYAILFLAIWLWWLILERYWYYLREHSAGVAQATATWNERDEHSSWYALLCRRGIMSEVEVQMQRNLKLIPTLIALLPMLGLLGTVTGMIQVFDVMAFMGSGNPRAMADGVSAATIPTMAGMVVALVAIPFASQLERRFREERHSLNEALKISDE